MGSPPPTMWIANAEEENQQEVGEGNHNPGVGWGFRAFGVFRGSSGVGWEGASATEADDGLREGKNCGCPFNHLPRNSRKSLISRDPQR